MAPDWEINYYENQDMYEEVGISKDDVMNWYHKGFTYQREYQNHILWNLEVAAMWCEGDTGNLHAFTRPLGYNEDEVEDNPFK